MVKKPNPPVIDDSGSGGERAIADARDRPFVANHDLARDDSDLEVRGRRYRIGVEDGFVGIWELRSGEQVGTYMEDAFSAAWARYLELEQARSFSRFKRRAREFAVHRWYAIAVLVLGALTVVYLKTEDPALPPTGGRARGEDAPLAVEPIAGLGSALAETLHPALAHAPSGRSAGDDHGGQQQKDRGPGGQGPPAGGSEGATAPSSSGTTGTGTSGGTSGGTSSGDTGGSTGGTGGSTGGDGGSGGGDVEPPPPPEDPPPTAQPPPEP